MEGFNIKHADLYDLLWEYKENLEANIAELDTLKENIKNLTEDEEFQGETAESVKAYYNEVQIPIIDAMEAVANSILDQFAIYMESYYNSVENSTNFSFSEEMMSTLNDTLQGYLDDTQKQGETVTEVYNAVIGEIGKYFDKPLKTVSDIEEGHGLISTDITNIIETISNLEPAEIEQLAGTTVILEDDLDKALSAATKNWSSMKNYKPGSATTNADMITLGQTVAAYNQIHEENKEELDNFWDYAAQVKESADAARDAGIWQAVAAAGLIAVGVICIVASCGAATPLVMGIGVGLGATTTVFGVSDMVEGGQNIYNGANGDSDTLAFNPVRDTAFDAAFGENSDEVYYGTELVVSTAASAMCPIANVASKGGLTMRTGTMLAGRELASTGAGLLGGKASSAIASQFTDNQNIINAAGLLGGMASGYGASKVGTKVYNAQYTKYLRSQSTCTDAELTQYLQSRVDECVKNGVDPSAAQKDLDNFVNKNVWNNDVQIPKSKEVLDPKTGGINWKELAKEGGYVVDSDGKAIKSEVNVTKGTKLDRYGSGNGTYVSPVNGERYSYSQRSLAYVEDYRQYHTYEVQESFTNVESKVDSLKDGEFKTNVQNTMSRYNVNDANFKVYGGEISRVDVMGVGGGTQYQMPLNMNQLEGLDYIKETNKLNMYDTNGVLKGAAYSQGNK